MLVYHGVRKQETKNLSYWGSHLNNKIDWTDKHAVWINDDYYLQGILSLFYNNFLIF